MSLLGAVLFCGPLTAQPRASAHDAASARATVPALLLSDIHFDPFLDPTKAAALNAAPAADWPRIFAAASDAALTPSQQSALQACTNETDTSEALWQPTLAEFRKTAAPSRFVILSGDFLPHKFDCKYKALLPGATGSSYVGFTIKTVHYLLDTLRAALPGVPIYAALGNNDSGCTDYSLDAEHDPFLTGVAPFIAEAADLTAANRTMAEHEIAALGAFDAPLAALPHTRIVSLDDLYLSANYSTCSGKHDAAPAAEAVTWLKRQLESARTAHEHVWFVSHIPPGVDLYATARRLVNVCGGAKPTMFLGSEDLPQMLAAYSDVVRLAIFGHTHDDEMRLLTLNDGQTQAANSRGAGERTVPESAEPAPVAIAGVPVKIVSSITPVHGNRPSFTLARVDPATATLIDYTVMISSDPATAPITWSHEYTYSGTYHEPAFDAASLTALIADFQGDPGDKWPASQAYIRNYFPAEPVAAAANSAVISAAWQPYACSLSHDSEKAFAACACRK
ncbi:MAG TPA: hypothetical protein VN612_06990 [Acidobacteriaceae bacterium]|nr:hypothetical protein [Acidobacteriaceae bacterium]